MSQHPATSSCVFQGHHWRSSSSLFPFDLIKRQAFPSRKMPDSPCSIWSLGAIRRHIGIRTRVRPSMAGATMRAVRFDQYGDVDVLKVVEVPRPGAGPGRLVVDVVAAAINPGEASIRKGLLQERWPATFPSGEGSDLAGVVSEVGEGIEGVVAGDGVIGWSDERVEPRRGRGPARRPGGAQACESPVGGGWLPVRGGHHRLGHHTVGRAEARRGRGRFGSGRRGGDLITTT